MNLDVDALQAVSNDLFSMMLGFHLEVPSVGTAGVGTSMTSEIRIVGDRTWRLEVSCPYLTASVIAARIFRLAPAELDDDLLLDAIGEVANILSGNLKGMLDGEYSLTLPSNHIGPPSAARTPVEQKIGLVLMCDDLPLQLNLCEESMEAALTTAGY